MNYDSPKSCPEPAVREPQVSGEISRLQNLEETLHKALCGLESRIKAILPNEPECDSKANPPEPCVCPLAERLRNLNNSLSSAISRLGYITSRIEL